MNRRDYLVGMVGLGAGFTGCIEPRQGVAEPPTADTTDRAEPVTQRDSSRRICQEPGRDIGIVEIVAPEFGPNWDGIDVPDRYGMLREDEVVIGIERGGVARAYPLSILWYHEIVNDDVGGPLLVSYCPLCKSGLVAERLVNGQPTVFRVSGLLWRPEEFQTDVAEREGDVFGADRTDGETEVVEAGNLVMVDDATRSYWSQLLARGICGPRKGAELTIVPSKVARWSDWRAEQSDTDVLLPPTGPGPPDLD